MSRFEWTEEKILERKKMGHGTGSGSEYRPWLEVFDFSSRGRSRRVWSPKTGRIHHFFSDVEYDIFIASEWSTSVIDIREQYPLDREITQTIAHDLKIRHPHYPGTQIPTVMTVDLLLTMGSTDGEDYVAFNAKRDEEAEDETSLEKLEIQRSYFEALGNAHHLIYHSRIPKQKVTNISWIRDAQLKPGEIEPHKGFFDQLKKRMARELASINPADNTTLQTYCFTFDQRYGTEQGTGLRVARMLMQERTLLVNLDSLNLLNNPVGSILMRAKPTLLHTVGGTNAV